MNVDVKAYCVTVQPEGVLAAAVATAMHLLVGSNVVALLGGISENFDFGG